MTSRCSRLSCCAVLLLGAGTASAGDWRISPRFTVAETYSDNPTLAHNPDSAGFMTALTPGLTLRGKSARVKTNIDYNFENLMFASNSKLDRENHQMQGNTNITVIDKWVFLDATGRMFQEAVDPSGNFIANSRSRLSTQRDVVGYTLTPRLKHSFAGWLNVDFNYNLGHTDYNGKQPVNSIIDGLSNANLGTGDDTGYKLRVQTGRQLAKTPLGVTIERRETSYQSGRSSKLDSIIGDAGYKLTRTFKLTGTGGMEENTFSGSGPGKTKGASWTMGGEWTPSKRTFVSFSAGHRYFGPTFNAKIRHKYRHLRTNFGYKEEVRTVNELQNGLLFVPQLDQNGNVFYDPLLSSSFRNPVNSPTVTEDTFITRETETGIDYSFHRSSLQVRLFSADREYQRAKRSEKIEAVTGNFSRAMSLRSTLGLNATWRHSKFSQNNLFDELVQLSPYYNYKLGPHTIATLSYDYMTADGASNAQQYTENAVTARLNFYY